jgi:hypothetical protein
MKLPVFIWFRAAKTTSRMTIGRTVVMEVSSRAI